MSLLRANGVIASEMEASVMMTLGAVYSGAPSPVGAKDANSVICGTSELSRVKIWGCTFIDTSGDVLASLGVCRLHTHSLWRHW